MVYLQATHLIALLDKGTYTNLTGEINKLRLKLDKGAPHHGQGASPVDGPGRKVHGCTKK